MKSVVVTQSTRNLNSHCSSRMLALPAHSPPCGGGRVSLDNQLCAIVRSYATNQRIPKNRYFRLPELSITHAVPHEQVRTRTLETSVITHTNSFTQICLQFGHSDLLTVPVKQVHKTTVSQNLPLGLKLTQPTQGIIS